MDPKPSNLHKENKSKNIIQIVNDGKNSEYWKLLKEQVELEIKKEQIFLDGFKSAGISKKDINEFNRARDRIVFLKNFLKINDKLIYENLTIIERLKEKINIYTPYRRINAFLNR